MTRSDEREAPVDAAVAAPAAAWASAERLLAAQLAALLVAKVAVNAFADEPFVDGAYYGDIAAHVRDGHGFVSSASLYHAGYPSFPYPSSVYPIWPLLLGLCARLAPLELLAVWLPTTFYFVTLIVGYHWVRALAPRPLAPATLPGAHAGHVFVALAGTSPTFFAATSQPFTEGLAFAALVTALWRWTRLFRTPTLAGGLEVGLTAAVLLLIRAQFVVVLPGVAVGAAVAALRAPGPAIGFGVAAAAGFLLGVAPQWAHLSTFVSPTPEHFLRFERFQLDPRLARIELLVPTDGPLDYLLDRGAGVLLAWNDLGSYAYAKNFGALQWALPAALLVWSAALVRDLRHGGLIARARAAWRDVRHPDAAYAAMFAAFGLAALVTLHMLHKGAGFRAWNFHIRHALPVGFVFGACLLWLTRQGAVPRLIAAWLFGASLYAGVLGVGTAAEQVRESEGWAKQRAAAVEWLERRRATDPDLRIATIEAQRLAWHTDGIGFHGVYTPTTTSDLRVLFDDLGADALLVPGRTTHEFLTDPVFEQLFRELPDELPGWRVFVRQPPTTTPAAL